jgi:NitT/TauT family transport system ATP-binding protein
VNAVRPGDATGAARDLVFSCRGASVELPHQGGTRRILEDISLELGRGEFLTVVGPSGTGKTTLLRLLGGLTPCTRGTVNVNGHPLDGPPADVVIVFQDYSHALLQWRTVARNVGFGIEGRVDAAELKRRVQDALQLVGLQKNADDYPWQLSGGMQQRVQIARALALRPAVLLMDEPFAALDAMTKATLQDELHRVREQTGSSFVFVTHDIEEAVYLGDRIAVITGTPGRLGQTFDIDLPKPRDQIITRQMPEFLQFRYAVHQAIRQQGHA